MTKKMVSVVLVGIAGYGNTYVKELLKRNGKDLLLVGVIDINPHLSAYYEQLKEKMIPIYYSLEEFYKRQEADLAIVSTPIHLHAEHSCMAMENGSHVLCEKPIAIDPKHIEQMRRTSKKTGKFLAVGFNWSFTPAIQNLKKDILAHKFGRPKRFKSITLWPRTKDYYTRSAWAGKKYSDQGDMICDSIASNATAHYLHHLLYLSGSKIDHSAKIRQVNAELYRVNDIETYDTCAVRMKTKSDIDIFYYASHAVNVVKNPEFILEFEKATVFFAQDAENSRIIVHWKDGNTSDYDSPNEAYFAKIDVCIQAILRKHHQILCGIEAATSHVEAIHAMTRSQANPSILPQSLITEDKEKNLLYVRGLSEDLIECYRNWNLPSDINTSWSQQGLVINL